MPHFLIYHKFCKIQFIIQIFANDFIKINTPGGISFYAYTIFLRSRKNLNFSPNRNPPNTRSSCGFCHSMFIINSVRFNFHFY